MRLNVSRRSAVSYLEIEVSENNAEASGVRRAPRSNTCPLQLDDDKLVSRPTSSASSPSGS
jgi:hypothetical protein